MAEMIQNRDTALLLLKIRNLILEESGIRIPLSEEGAVERFLELADQSTNPKLKQVAVRLRQQLGISVPRPAATREATGHQRVYRGIALAEGTDTPHHPQSEPQHQPPQKGKVITYRGQKMVI